MIVKIAWRNIWRNRRRTLITAASIFFAVLLAVSTNALNRGTFNKMINDTVGFSVGFGQVMSKGYWDERSLNLAYTRSAELEETLKSIPQIDALVGRLESGVLASKGDQTKIVMVAGIDPVKEAQLTGLDQRVESGAYLEADDQAILIGEGLAEKLDLAVGDSLILTGQGYHGVNAAGHFPIKGIVHFGLPEMSSQTVYLPLKAAQWFYGAEGLITTTILDIKDKDAAEKAFQVLREKLDTSTYELMEWDAMLPELVEMKALKESSNKVTVFILYLIIAFGIFGTILMMTKERSYEFGVLLSIGMKRSQLALSIWIETMFLALLGIAAGLVLSYALMYALMVNPIELTGEAATVYAKFGVEPLLPAAVDLDLFYTQALNVLIITTLLAMYPCYSIFRLQPVAAMRS